jgi:hypothetical protein
MHVLDCIGFSTRCSTHPLASQFPVEIRLKFLNQRMFIRHILRHRQYMSGASVTTGEMWPSRFRVECQLEFEPPHREALLQSGILSLEAVWGGCGALFRLLSSRYYLTLSATCGLALLACTTISDDLLHHEERIFREECIQYSIG